MQKVIVLMTDGDWNCKDSFTQSGCPEANPVTAAAQLFAADPGPSVRVHVVGFADGAGEASLDAVAAALAVSWAPVAV